MHGQNSVVALLCMCLLGYSEAALMKLTDIISSDEVDIVASRIDKRSPTDDEFVDLQLNVNGEVVRKRLRKLGQRSDATVLEATSTGYDLIDAPRDGQSDWAVYGEDDMSILVKNHPTHGTRMEGSLYHKGQHYFIQPKDGTSRHVLNKLPYSGHVTLADVSENVLKRFRRKADPNKYECELHLVFDYQMYTQWEAITPSGDSTIELIREYYGVFINELNHMFNSFKRFGIQVDIVMGGLTVFTEYDGRAPYHAGLIVPGATDSTRVLTSFTKWVAKDHSDYDAVQLHTGYPLKGVKGVCWYVGICTDHNTGILENDMNYIATFVAAHELGHNFGIQHDDKTGCGNYIMYPSVQTVIWLANGTEKWKFSECTINGLKNFLTYLNTGRKRHIQSYFKKTQKDNCMLYRNEKYKTKIKSLAKYGKTLPGAELTLDQQCNRQKRGSKFCPHYQLRHPLHKICLAVYCSPNPTYCTPVSPYPGTPCGNNKICEYGHCISSSKGKAMDESCPFGDTPGAFWSKDKLTCQQAVAKYGGNCYELEWKCCTSCGKIKDTTIANCSYGDRRARAYIGRKVYTDCAELVKVAGPGACYKNAHECCKTCAQLEDKANEKCMYGDHPLVRPMQLTTGEKFATCKEAIDAYSGVCYRQSKVCCGSCAKVFDAENKDCPYGDQPGHKVRDENGRLAQCPKVITKDNAGACYGTMGAKACCASCAEYKRENQPGCAYGDYSGKVLYKNNRKTTCKDAIKSAADSGLCYEAKTKCCETCAKYKTGGKGCEWGDVGGKVIRVNGVLTTCKEGVSKEQAYPCYKYSDKCCESCKTLATGGEGCEYGDKDPAMCASRLSKDSSACYDSNVLAKCCKSCKGAETGDENCPYGDRPVGTVYIADQKYHTCKAAVAVSAGVCYEYEKQCCKSCAKLGDKSNEYCRYGDRPFKAKKRVGREAFDDCASIVKKYPGYCYDNIKDCCTSCKAAVNTKNPACKFGDKLGKPIYSYARSAYVGCGDVISGSDHGMCYQYGKNDCCGTCEKYKTDTKGCEYGDHSGTVAYVRGVLSTCQVAVTRASAKRACRDGNTRTQCCGSCRKYA